MSLHMHPIKNPATVKENIKGKRRNIEMFQKKFKEVVFSDEAIYICTV